MREANGKTVAGARQTLRLIAAGQAEKVFIALDASPRVTAPVREAATNAGVPIEECESMASLGRRCRIAVECAVAAASLL